MKYSSLLVGGSSGLWLCKRWINSEVKRLENCSSAILCDIGEQHILAVEEEHQRKRSGKLQGFMKLHCLCRLLVYDLSSLHLIRRLIFEESILDICAKEKDSLTLLSANGELKQVNVSGTNVKLLH